MEYAFINKKAIIFSTILLSLLTLSVFIQIPGVQKSIFNSVQRNDYNNERESPQKSETDYYSKDWITNGDFSAGSTNWTSEVTGDTSDVSASISGGTANYVVGGNTGTFTLNEDPPNNSSGNWHSVTDPYFPSAAQPYQDGINSDGFWFRHYFQEGSGLYTQLASKVWARNFTLDRNIQDYTITSASLSATFNATVYRDVDIPGDSYADSSGNPITYSSSYDFGRFFLLLSDVNRNILYEAGYYHIDSLGSGYSGQESMPDTALITVTGSTLIYFLTSILSQDHQTFSLALGIRVYCEDNRSPSDTDRWQYLLFNNINLAFTYEKKVDAGSKISWKQNGDTIPSNYNIENATLNFQYKIDKDWISNTGSPNSDFRIIINNNQLGETVKLSTATGSYQYFKSGGIDVANLLTSGVEVNLSIQVYIADEFTLDSDITINIDNVTLVIGYGIFTPPDTTSYQLLLNNVDRTTEKSTQVIFNEDLNVSLVYKDSLGSFIPSADVELTGGGLTPITLTEGTDNYYTIINSTDLGVGITYLTLTASRRYYTTQELQITVEVASRNTEIQLFLDKNNSTIDKEWTTDWNADLNITIKYLDIEDSPSTHISGATVELTGVGATKNLIEDSGNDQYEISINTFDIGVGSAFLTVYASKENYTSLNIRFKIVVTTRNTYLDNLKLDNVVRTSYEIAWNEMFDISVSYNDTITDNFITGATVQLLGTGYSKTLSQSGESYVLTINTFDLSIGNNFLTVLAQKNNYSLASQLITIIVKERDTTIASILNHTITTTIYYPHGELLNITAIYNDASGPFINGASVQLREGTTVVYNLTKSLSFDQYSVEINTDELNIGVNLLTLYAKKDNFSAAFVSLTIIVDERDVSLDIFLDTNSVTVIEKSYDETVNITAIYRDFENYFIDGATVELREGGSLLNTIPKHSSFDQYTIIINTKDLSLGTNLLAIHASKENYSSILVSITIIVGERNTDIDVYLEGNPTTALIRSYDEVINITAVYRDTAGPFIDGATVELREGETILYTIPKHGSFDQYTLTLNTKNLNLGTNLLAIYAKKDNFSVALVSITITVTERDTNIDVYLEGNPTTLFEVPYGNTVNITVIYSDLSGPFIDGATVELRNGTTLLNTLTKHPSLNQYYVTKDSTQFQLGSNIFSIYAKKDNYSAALVSILIIVVERDTSLDIYLNGNLTTAIDVTYGEDIDFVAIYEDFTSTFINGATVELRQGTTTINSFTKHLTLDQYILTKNSNELNLGSNVFTVYAKQNNYSVALESILITVNERDTSLKVLLEGTDISTIEYYNISINQALNITAIYEDYVPSFVSGALVQLTGSGVSETLSPHPSFSQYNYTLNLETLGVGIHFLVITAQKENYSSAVQNIKINVLERGSNLQLYINDNNLTSERYIAAEIDQTLNVTIYYTDSSDDSFVPGARVRLTGALNDNFTENAILQHYNVTIQTNDLEQGINFLTIFAQKEGYVSKSIVFTIEVIEKDSNLQLFLNGANETFGKSIEVTVGELVNVTVVYEDYSKNFIDNAEVLIVGEGIDLNLTKNPLFNQYNVTIDSDDLNFGINLLTLYAKRVNYQPQTLIVRIEIIEKETDMNIFLNGLNRTLDRTLTLPIRQILNVTVKYFEFETSTIISGASIQLLGEGLNVLLSYNPSYQQYSTLVNTNDLDIGVRFLTLYAQRANYQSYSALLRIQVNRIRTNITTVSGETVINKQPGQNYKLEIDLVDLDFSTSVLNATVTYTWTYGQGTLTDPNNDGIYEGTISNLREGTFVITISVYAGDDYEFDRFTVTLNVVRPPEDVLLFQVLTIVGIGAAIGLGGYLFAYQRVLKYPKQVRKIRKYKSKLKKPKSLGIETRSRDQIIQDNYAEKIHPLEKTLKSKMGIKAEIEKEPVEKTQNN